MNLRAPGLRWWREVVYILAFYFVYSFVRNAGTGSDHAAQAFTNATRIIGMERAVLLYVEEGIQHAFLGAEWFIRGVNVFYGTCHFIVTAAALVWCFRRMPERYGLWRNTLAFTTGLALLGFALFPLMPPRLLPASYGYVDTLARIGGLWSFESSTMKSISNQYAAMPSLHFGWALWSACVLWPAARAARRASALLRALVLAYPPLTLFAIVLTANHFWLDAVGGAAVLGVGYAASSFVTARASARSSASNVATASS